MIATIALGVLGVNKYGNKHKDRRKDRNNGKASAKVIAAITALILAASTVLSRKRQVAEAIASEAKREGLDENGARKMATASWLEAKGIAADKATKAERDSVKFDVSKVMTLAYPDKPDQLKAAYAFNDANADKPKQARIGENDLLEIARGNLTAKQAIAGKAPKRPAGKNGSGNLDKVLSPSERMQNAFAGVFSNFKVGAKDRPSVEDTREAFDKALKAYVGEKVAAK
jgi:hypothetical protein